MKIQKRTIADRFTAVHTLHNGQLIPVPLHQLYQMNHDFLALGGMYPRPHAFVVGLPGLLDRIVHVFFAARRDIRDHLARCRIRALKGLPRFRRGELAVNVRVLRVIHLICNGLILFACEQI